MLRGTHRCFTHSLKHILQTTSIDEWHYRAANAANASLIEFYIRKCKNTFLFFRKYALSNSLLRYLSENLILSLLSFCYKIKSNFFLLLTVWNLYIFRKNPKYLKNWSNFYYFYFQKYGFKTEIGSSIIYNEFLVTKW